MTPEEFDELLAFGREQHHVEFKPPGPRDDKDLWPRVARAVMAMANRRDGGMVIIGVKEDAAREPDPVGIPDAQRATWRHDDIADALAALADPPIEFETEVLSWQGRHFVVLGVREFSETPVVCKRSRQDTKGKVILQEGKCYVRSRRKPESTEVGTSADMRDLLDLAAEKRLRRFFALSERAGLTAQHLQSDNQRYEQEIATDEPAVAGSIRSRGDWTVRISPTEYREDRVGTLAELESIVERCQIRSGRGWYFPHIATQEAIERYQRHVQQSIDWDRHKEFWQFYQSGQFRFAGGLIEDWLDKSGWVSAPSAWAPGQLLSVSGMIYRATGALELASRLAGSAAGGESMRVEMTMRDLRGRRLELDMAGHPWDRDLGRQANEAEFSWSSTYSRSQLAADARGLALTVAARLFALFGWDASPAFLREVRDELIK
jgi:hypothetical protein